MITTSIKIKIAASIMGGLLISVSVIACGETSVVEEQQATTPSLPAPVEFTPAPTVSGLPTGTPTPTTVPVTPLPKPTPKVPPMPIPTPKHGPFVYHTIAPGQTLGYISSLYDTPIEQLIEMNDLDGPSAIIRVEQTLRVPVQTDDIASNKPLFPDSEVVYGPSTVDFDIEQFVKKQNGYLANYQEWVDGEPLSGPEIVERVSEQFSVGPRLLLAFLDYYGTWVTNPTPTETQLNAPLGPRNPRGADLYRALSFTANRINAGYYGYKRDGFWIFYLPDGSEAISAPGLNAGTIGVQNMLAVYSNWDTWQQEMQGNGLLETYQSLFGDPFDHDTGPVVPIDLTQPPLNLPWAKDQNFYFTSGPHAGYVDGSAWAAIDFGPPDVLANCFYSAEPSTAAADGVIVVARQGEVYLDLDGDGNIQTGWVLFYLHVALDSETPVQVGQTVKQDDVIGYASCEAGLSNSSHLHFARRYNGEWMAAGGPVPMNLNGWVVQSNLVPYEGTIAKGDQVREAYEGWEPDINLIVNTGSE